jgi:Holliday junction resolvase
MDTKNIGTRGELAVTEILMENGYTVSREISDSARYDLITDKDGELKRVQVKTTTFSPELARVYVNREKITSGKKNLYTKSQIDQMAWYIADKNLVVLIDIEVFGDRNRMYVQLPSPVEPGAAVLTQQPGVRFLSGAPIFSSQEEQALFRACRKALRDWNEPGAFGTEENLSKIAVQVTRQILEERQAYTSST